MASNRKNSTARFPFSAFTTICIFVVLIIIGVAVLPLQSIQLEPTRNFNSISIYFNWPSATPDLVENEVTVKLENLLSTVTGISNITSVSDYEGGRIKAGVDAGLNVYEIRYEVSTLIRQLYDHLPEGVTYPRVYVDKPFGNRTLLSYTFYGKGDAYVMRKLLNEKFRFELAAVKGVLQVNVSENNALTWRLTYNGSLLKRYGISLDDLKSGIDRHLFKAELGSTVLKKADDANSYIFLSLATNDPDHINWKNVWIKKNAGRNIYMTDVANVELVSSKPGKAFRINGCDALTLELVAGTNSNYLTLAAALKSKMAKLIREIPRDYKVQLEYDSSIILKKELNIVLWRSAANVLIVLIFIGLLSRQPRYLYLIVITLLSNLLIASAFYYFLRLEIHLFSLAGIAISFGIIVDNTIIVIDHIRNKKNFRVLAAVTGTTLISIGCICIIFFLGQEYQVKLLDFAWIMIVNMIVSLGVCIFLIPALLKKLPLSLRSYSDLSTKRRIVKWSVLYTNLIGCGLRFKKTFIVILILTFGTPVFLLPSKIESDNQWADAYNTTIGSEHYNEKIRPWINIFLGGSLRAFFERDGNGKERGDHQVRTVIHLDIRMPVGTSSDQMSLLAENFEDFLMDFKKTEQVKVRMEGNFTAIDVSFNDDVQNGTYPKMLKNRLEEKAGSIGLAEFNVSGMGLAFNNEERSQKTTNSIVLSGYNYRQLLEHARFLKSILEQSVRVEKVTINSQREVYENADPEYHFTFSDADQFLVQDFSVQDVKKSFNNFPQGSRYLTSVNMNGGSVPVVAGSTEDLSSMWSLMNGASTVNERSFVRLRDLIKNKNENPIDKIIRENQQYRIFVNYNFLGDYFLSNVVTEKALKQTIAVLPLGYSVSETKQNYWSGNGNTLLWTVFLALSIIFLISTVILNSVRQSISVLVLVPISFIGVFCVASAFSYEFADGGYAAMIILCSIVINAGIYILTEFNSIRIEYPGLTSPKVFIKAWRSKVMPVLISLCTMILSLLPFIIYDDNEVFWYALAVSTIGGILFSTIALLLFLPIFLLKPVKSGKQQLKSIQTTVDI